MGEYAIFRMYRGSPAVVSPDAHLSVIDVEVDPVFLYKVKGMEIFNFFLTAVSSG